MSDVQEYRTRRCVVCGLTSTMWLSVAAVEAWQGGMLIQYAFPDMDPREREMLISGTHPECFERLFGSGEE